MEENKEKLSVVPILFHAKQHVGNAVLGEDGYYYFQIIECGIGFWSENNLDSIANEIRRLNKQWHNQVTRDFEDGRE